MLFFDAFDVFVCFQNLKDSLIKSTFFRPNVIFEENLIFLKDFCTFLHVSHESSMSQVVSASQQSTGPQTERLGDSQRVR